MIVQDLSFDVFAGEIFGFLGPNGAGKTTTIRMLVGLMKPSIGSVTIGGFDLQRNYVQAMAHVGCIVENPELYKFLTGRENLEQFARMSGSVDDKRIREVAQLVGLEHRLDEKVRTYSLGMKQRLGIAQALLTRPQLLILDEPTNGLDPSGIRELREFIKYLAKKAGMAVFVSSHILSEIEMLCDRVAILHHGKIIRAGTVRELLYGYAPRTEWEVSNIKTAQSLLQQFLIEEGIADSMERMICNPNVLMADADHPPAAERRDGNDMGTIVCAISDAWIPRLNEWFVSQGIGVYAIRKRSATLEELFLEVTEEANGGEAIGAISLSDRK
ncbi:ABC transporter ATP-binding protein [Fodinisporobacter ferrooxydans]|uniref:ABC transporter ATP-binding protein n=1 Tax=Fodinisporobacter ferrooxydans TaxID=2901836 RepID=A0ABY4CR50_9BACL|nr:ABC transporter ATP-binding protein [Alicyclobacillaceae bacterium MYW30-H2]